jgi:hypothetical protein
MFCFFIENDLLSKFYVQQLIIIKTLNNKIFSMPGIA